MSINMPFNIQCALGPRPEAALRTPQEASVYQHPILENIHTISTKQFRNNMIYIYKRPFKANFE